MDDLASKLTVMIGPFARFKYDGLHPDVGCLTCGSLREVNAEDVERGILHVVSNKISRHEKSFHAAYSEVGVVPLDASAREDALVWFAQVHEANLNAIEKFTGSAAEVLYGIVAEYM